MSDSNRLQIRYIEETTWGVTPATASMQELRFTGESLRFNISNEVSREIRSDRQVSDLIQAGADCSGSLEWELSYGTYDAFMAAALFSDWSADLNISETNTIAATASGFTASGGAGHDFADIQPGQWIKVGGFTANDGENNGFYRVLTAAAGTLTTSPAPAGLEAAAAGKTITVNGSMLRNGTTKSSFSLEKVFDDLSPKVYEAFVGMMVNGFSGSVQANSVLSGSFEFIGKTASAGTVSVSPGSVNDATTSDVMNAVANVASIQEAGSDVSSGLVSALEFSVGNNLRGQSAIGVLGFRGVGVGKMDVTGSLTAFFENKNLQDKYIAGTESSLSFRVNDAKGNTYIFSFPRVKFESSEQSAGGQDSDIMQALNWRSIRHATYDCQIQIDKFAGA